MKLDLAFQLKHPAYRPHKSVLRALTVHACQTALAHEGLAETALSVILADDKSIRQLNREFRGKDKATNVLSFPSEDSEYLGDIMVSLDTVDQEAETQGKSFEDHLSHLLVHSCLHLLGHDHMKKAEAKTMEAKEIKILESLGVGNPYE